MPKPKGSKKNGSIKSPMMGDAVLDEDETAKSEAGTNYSSASDNKTINLDDGGALADVGDDQQVDTSGNIDHLEYKLKEEMENATNSVASTRVKAVVEINLKLERRLFVEFVDNHKEGLADIVDKSLRRGKTTEQVLASRLLGLMCIQLGGDCGCIYGKLRPTVLTIFTDGAIAPQTRASCAEVLGVGSFIAEEEPEVFEEVVHKLSKTFSLSFLKGDGTTPQFPAEVAELHRQSLVSWALLMTIASNKFATEEISLYLQKLPQLLDSSYLELRIAAGETIALLNELIRDSSLKVSYSKLPSMNILCEKLKQLATESTKHRAKKDQKHQRSSFRDVLHSVQDDDGVFQRVRFGKEVLDLHSWRSKQQYNAFCNLLQTGLNYHLRANPLIREIFDLGEILPDELQLVVSKKSDKFQRQLQQTAADKERTLARNVHRGNKQAGKDNFDGDEE